MRILCRELCGKRGTCSGGGSGEQDGTLCLKGKEKGTIWRRCKGRAKKNKRRKRGFK